MQTLQVYSIKITKQFDEEELKKGTFISIIHASRIPPHIGMIFNGCYHSLTIKGQEINHSVEALIKNIKIRKIPALFIKIKPHPIFSIDYLNEYFISSVQQFSKVEINKATCLSPVKLFFEETFNITIDHINYIFELLPELETSGLIENVSSVFIDTDRFPLPIYNYEEINKGIETAENEIRLIKREC
jgi:hypothetical protein